MNQAGHLDCLLNFPDQGFFCIVLRVAFHVLRLNHGSAASVLPAPRAKPKRGAARNARRERPPMQWSDVQTAGATECYKR